MPSTICSQISYLLYEHMCMCVRACVWMPSAVLRQKRKKAKKSPFQMFPRNEDRNVCLIRLLFKYANKTAQAGFGLVGSPGDFYKRVGNKAWKRKLASCSFSSFISEISPVCTCSGTIKLLQLKFPHHCHGFCVSQWSDTVVLW